MNYVKVIILSHFFAIYSLGGWAQTNDTLGFISDDETTYPVNNSPLAKKSQTNSKVFTQAGLGFSAGTMFNGTSYYQTNAYAKVGYYLTPKWTVSMGLMGVQTYINDLRMYNYEGQLQNMNYSGLSTYYTLQTAYQVNPNLSVYGGVMVGSSSLPTTSTTAQNTIKVNPKAYQLGLEYKLGSTTLNLEIQYRDGFGMGQNVFDQTQSNFGNRPMFR